MPSPSFRDQASALGFDLSAAQVEAFAAYRDMILDAAARFSLTAVRDAAEIERRHFLESLALARALEERGVPANADMTIDIGSGAGIPGIPIKIARPETTIALLESNEKRCRFLREVIAALRLDGAGVLEGRAEVWGRQPGHREAYGLALARAVAPLAVLAEYALPFVMEGGWLAAPKGSAGPREVREAARALAELGGELVSAEPFLPPAGPAQTLVLVRKVAPTPERYPRRAGIPAKRPLT